MKPWPISPTIATTSRMRHLVAWLGAATFCAVYVLFDWASYIDPLHHFNITPWNPAPALGILYLLRRNAGGALTLFIAILATDLIVRDLDTSVMELLFLDALLAVGYTAMAMLMQRHLPDGGMFANRTDLGKWSLIVVFGALVLSIGYVSSLAALGLLPISDWSNAVLRFWIGDGVGIFVTFPLLWCLQDNQHRVAFRLAAGHMETVGYLGMVAFILWLIFAPSGINDPRYLYALFLPVVWAASRQGIIGAVFCASVVQLGMLLAGWLWEIENVSAFELQIRALLLAGVGFVIGIAVDEQRRAVADLHQSLRLAAAGEMAAALAHELNQPLTALAAYGEASALLITREGGSSQLRDVIQRMIAEASRAAEVVRRLRDFFRTGSTHLERFSLVELIEDSVCSFKENKTAQGLTVEVAPLPLVHLHADRLQIEVVLRNLLSNALDAVADLPDEQKHISITATLPSPDQLCICVEDSGPGLSAMMMDGAFEPFSSTKSSGLGLGLAISRAIAEAHGGSLVATPGNHGSFMLNLPIDPKKVSAHG